MPHDQQGKHVMLCMPNLQDFLNEKLSFRFLFALILMKDVRIMPSGRQELIRPQ